MARPLELQGENTIRKCVPPLRSIRAQNLSNCSYHSALVLRRLLAVYLAQSEFVRCIFPLANGDPYSQGLLGALRCTNAPQASV